jgi:hypothetical protein
VILCSDQQIDFIFFCKKATPNPSLQITKRTLNSLQAFMRRQSAQQNGASVALNFNFASEFYPGRKPVPVFCTSVIFIYEFKWPERKQH